MPYREKRVLYGDYLDAELYPVTLADTRASRKVKTQQSRIAQKNLNDRNAKKHVIRLINGNFSDQDIVVHLTYDQVHLPHDPKQAQKDLANFVRRIKGARKRQGLSALRYLAVIECANPDECSPAIRIHHHIVMSGDLSRDEVESLWGKGRANADRLKADKSGYEGLARYMSKDPRGSKRWCASKNLKQPEVHVNDHKYSKRKVEQLAKNYGDYEQIELLYPGYEVIEARPEVNEINGGIYLYIKMRRRPDPARKEVRRGKSRKRDPALLSG
jgi:hypothetical protein